MSAETDTIHDLDVQLDRCRRAFLTAEERGDLDAAALALRKLDTLLDRRIACPQTMPEPRGASES